MKEIYYEIHGKGYPILMLHGNGETHKIFAQLVSDLEDKYQCVCIDTRYHGKSVKQGELSYEQFSKDVKGVVDELGFEEYDVIGFSDGAIISLLLEDKRLKHMVLIGPNSKKEGVKPLYRFNNYLMLVCLLPFCIYDKRMRVRWRLIKLMETMKPINQKVLNNIRIPTLILSGENDMIKASDIEYIHENIEFSVSKVIKNGNHFLLGEFYDETFREIDLFLKACHEEDEL